MQKFSKESIEKMVKTKSQEIQKKWEQPAKPPKLWGTIMLQMFHRAHIIVNNLGLCKNPVSLTANVALIITDLHMEFSGKVPSDEDEFKKAIKKTTRKWAKQGSKKRFCHGTTTGLVCYCDEKETNR